MSQTAKTRIVYLPLYPGVQLLDVSGPAEVLAQANRVVAYTAYDLRYVSSQRSGSVISSAGLGLMAAPLPDEVSGVHTLLIPGADGEAIKKVLADQVLFAWLDRVASNAKRNASVCSGTFLLGQLGLLQGRQVTTHWMAVERLKQEYPDAMVEPDALYVHDADLWTSAGVLSGVDMALAIVSDDLGADVALQIARDLVVFLIRGGGQSQFSAPIDLQGKASRSDLLRLIAWLEGQLDRAVTVEQMAEFMLTSVRTLHRRCQTTLSMTPAQILSELRLERGRSMLHQGATPVKLIADSCGFSNAAAFSKAFNFRFGVAPARYRQSFQNKSACSEHASH